MKKFLSVLMAMILMMSFFSFSFISNAIENDNSESIIMPRWATISSYSVGFEVSGLTASFNASLNASYYTNLKVVVQLQKETSTGYKDVETWTASRTSDVTITCTGSKIINPLNNYRIRVTYTADQESIVVFKYE